MSTKESDGAHNNNNYDSTLLTPPHTVCTKQITSTISSTSLSANEKIEKCEYLSSSGDNNSQGGYTVTSKRSECAFEMKELLKCIENECVSSTISDHDVSGDCQTKTFPAKPKTKSPRLQNLYENKKYTNLNSGDYQSPQMSEQKVTLAETLFVPVKKYPKYNFVGRILGPRGMTVKQLERETGCKIFVRGRASSTAFNPHTKMLRGGVISNKSSLSTISQGALTDDPLHVYIEITDFESSAREKMKHAVSVIKNLLSPPADGKDELKRQQLVDISLINGTYRPTNSTNNNFRRNNRSNFLNINQTVDPTSNPVDLEDGKHSKGVDEIISVYQIPNQKRLWYKPRGPDIHTEEYAKSAASREYVSGIVHRTKEDGREACEKTKEHSPNASLPPALVAESLKIANNLLGSHQKIKINTKKEQLPESPKVQSMPYPTTIPQQPNCDYQCMVPNSQFIPPTENPSRPFFYGHPPNTQEVYHPGYYTSPPLPYPSDHMNNPNYPYPGFIYMWPTFDTYPRN